MAAGGKLRVLVVEDSLTVRRRLCEVLAADPGIEVVGEATDGRQAIALARDLRPDVISLDICMPVMSGLAVTEYVMAHFPTPILIVSGSTNRGELFKTYDALAAGAVDTFDKPSGDDLQEGEWERHLLERIKLVARIRVITHPRGRLPGLARVPGTLPPAPGVSLAGAPCRAVGLGVSTGGPAALLEVLGALPAGFPIPILIVIHIGEMFAAGFAEWLGGLVPLPVAYARDRQPLPAVGQPGILLAPPDRHLELRGEILYLTSAPERHSCRPSVDVLFESMASTLGSAAAGCLLTGMGRDGASGLLALRQAGAWTAAQDEATSVVFGMPREAIRLGAAAEVLALPDVGPRLAKLAGGVGARLGRP